MRRGLALPAGLLAACAAFPPAPRGGEGGTGDWASPIGREHPLAGRVFDLARRSESSEAELVAALRGGRFALLGESHENADHHRLQARLLAALVAGGAAPVVALEMLRADQQPALDAALAAEAPSAAALRAAMLWDESGWPPFALYAPIFETALSARLPIVAADLTADERKLLASGEPVPAALRARLGLDEELPAELQRSLESDLLAGHCHMLPESALPRLVRVQRGRDAALAQALLAAAGAPEDDTEGEEPAEGVQAVLVAGAEHARLDRGAPRALARLAPGASVVSMALLEIDPEEEDVWDDLDARYGDEEVFDFVWYTPKASDEDYCERMKRGE
jgi:uncharacterized iron-regulated protein